MAVQTVFSCDCGDYDVNNNQSAVQEYQCPIRNISIRKIKCLKCQKCVVQDSKFKIQSPLDWLICQQSPLGWQKLKDEEDLTRIFVLSQVMYNMNAAETEPLFDMPDPNDNVKIFWTEGAAVAFYTTKGKGTLDPIAMGRYAANTLDTAYVMPAHRRKGIGVSMLLDMCEDHPKEDIAISNPISNSMAQVILKFLDCNPSYKMKLWGVDGPGFSNGDKQLLFYSLKKLQIGI